MASDPGDKVPPNLLAHVHLVSIYQFQFHPSPLTLETALRHLLQAPKVVRELSPVNWQFVTPPRDGTIFLAWQPTKQMGNTCATDGYVWADPERTLVQEYQGYKIEIFVFESGYVPGEPVATHRRVRYRLLASPTGESVNPNLEIIHYTRSSPDQQLHSKQIPVTPQKHQLQTQRRYLEQVGALVRKDFMLHDSNNWPTISMPTSRQPMVPNPYQTGTGFPGGGFPQNPRGSQHNMNPSTAMRSGMGPSPAKRAPRPPGPSHMPRLHPSQDEELAAEENAQAVGDFLDSLSPREISFTRYTQHHEWMEEIVSSPYAIRQITPVELGFGLAGELSGLTQDLFERKSVEEAIKGSATNSDDFAEIAPDKLEELERRIAKFEQEGKDEITAMKAEHAQKMQKLSKQKLLLSLEKRLAQTSMEEIGGEAVEEIVREAELVIGSKITQRDEIVRVEKGGLLNRGEEAMNANGDTMHAPGDEFNEFTNLDSNGDGFDFLSGANDSSMTFDT